MPGDVIYKSKEDAYAYAEKTGGMVIPVDQDGDGVQDGHIVVPRISSEGTRGPTPSEVAGIDPEAEADTKAYLEAVAAAGGPSEEDELGYRHGGMNYTNRGSVKYAKGGAVRGKTFRGSY